MTSPLRRRRLDLRAVRRLFAAFGIFLSAAPLAAATLTVRGTVRTPAGDPLPGARVEILVHPTNFEVELTLLARHLAPPAIAETSTDRTGRFALEVPGPGIYRVHVTAAGFVAMRYFLLPLAEPVELPPVALPREVSGRFTLVDAAGVPVEGATVFVTSAAPSRWRPWTRDGWRIGARLGWTDETGRLDVSLLRGETLSLTVFPPGHAAAQRFQDVAPSTLHLDTAVRTRRTIEVRDARGEPAAGVAVAGELASPLGRTGGDGVLVLFAGGASTLKLQLLTEHGRRDVVEVVLDNLAPAELSLASVVTVAGRVEAAGGGTGVAGAVVWPTDDPGRFVRTDESGAYRLLLPRAGALRIQADAPGFLSRALEVPEDEVRRGHLPAIALEPAAAVSGRFVGRDGLPIPGVQVTAAEKVPSRGIPAYRADSAAARGASDAGGFFELRGLRTARTYVLTAERQGFTTAEVEVAGLGPFATRPLPAIVLSAGRLAFGRVVDVEERPIAGAEVRLLAAGAPSPAPSAGDGGEEDPFTATSGADGRFEVLQVPAAKVDMTARRSGYAPLTVRGIEVPPGTGEVDLGTLILAPGAVLRGLVVDGDGVPVAGAEVWVSEELNRPPALAAAFRRAEGPRTASDDEGRFSIGDLVPGRKVDLFFDRDGYLGVEVPGVEAPRPEPLRVALERAGRVRGRVIDEAGAPVADAEVSLRPLRPDEEARPYVASADGRGEFVLEDVAPGKSAVSAYAWGFVPSSEAEVEIGADVLEVADLRFVLRRGASLEGRVSDGRGEPVAGARVSVGRVGAASREDGTYRLEGLPEGPGAARVEHPGYNRLLRELEILAGENRADFELAGGHPAGGRVVDEDGQEVEGATVELSSDDVSDPRTYRAVTRADGGFGWQRLAAGTYTLRASKEGFTDARREDVQVEEEPVDDLEVVLRRGASIRGRIFGLEPEDLGSLVVTAAADGASDRRGRVDFEGRYEIADLPPDDYLLTARVRAGRRQATARVTIEPGVAEVTRDLEFGGGLTLTGEVLHGGEPLSGADVSLDGQDVAVRREVTTDSDGLFEVGDLLPGRYRLGLAHFPRSLVYNAELELVSDRHLTIEVATAWVSGLVVSEATGEGIGDAVVAMKQLLESGEEGSLFTVGTDVQGFFRQEQLATGRYRLSVHANGYEPTEQVVELVPGGALEGLEIPLAPTSGLDLVVRLDSGRWLQFVHLRLLDTAGRVVLAKSRVPDEAGQVRFSSVPAGRWRLQVSAPGGAMTETEAEVPGDPVVLTLADAGDLDVRVPALLESDAVADLTVFSEDGRPFHDLGLGGELQGEWRVVGGRANVSGVPAGSWILRVTSAEGQVWTGSVRTTGGPTVEVRLEEPGE